MPIGSEKQISEFKQSLSKRLPKPIKNNFGLRSLLWIPICILSVTFLLFIYHYLNQPFHIKAHTVIGDVLGEVYEDGDNPTREQVLQIIYGVFCDLEIEGFEDAFTDAKDIISWAQDRGVLKGRLDGLCLDQAATKQESLVFIGRSLSTKEMDEANALNADEWAIPQINGLFIQEQLKDTDELGDLRETINVSELEGLLDQIVKHKTQYVGFWKFVLQCVMENKLISAVISAVIAGFTLAPSIIEKVSPIYNTYEIMKGVMRGRKDKKRRKGTIYLMGSEGVGKSTLKTHMIEQYGLKHEQKSKKVYNRDGIVIRSSNGDVLFDVVVLNGKQHELREMLSSNEKNKILLLVLAHTKARSGGEMDWGFIEEQLNEIRLLWMRIIPELEGWNKIIILINKTDLLPKKKPHFLLRNLSNWFQDFINKNTHRRPNDNSPYYKDHVELLRNTVKEVKKGEDGYIYVVKGSAGTGAYLSKLYQALRTNPPGSE